MINDNLHIQYAISFFARFITVLPQAARAKYHKLGGLASIYFSEFRRLEV